MQWDTGNIRRISLEICLSPEKRCFPGFPQLEAGKQVIDKSACFFYSDCWVRVSVRPGTVQYRTHDFREG